ncbi:MAG: hypothetical protein BMS9Abin37_0876 [Acidobacteriota bacterium]|nr:MAG: hypothetical protein BMS9Abin37_0876 [Acidobacteriota bacterium]
MKSQKKGVTEKTMAKKVTKKKTPTKKKSTTRKRTTAKKPAKTVVAARFAPTVTDDQIRIRAFEIYSSGRNPSNPDADWHQAEQELRT